MLWFAGASLARLETPDRWSRRWVEDAVAVVPFTRVALCLLTVAHLVRRAPRGVPWGCPDHNRRCPPSSAGRRRAHCVYTTEDLRSTRGCASTSFVAYHVCGRVGSMNAM